MTISITPLSKYLSMRDFGPSMELTLLQAAESGRQALPWEGGELPWNGVSCLSVVCYVLKFCSNSEHSDVYDTITRLNDLVVEYDNAKPQVSDFSDTLRRLRDAVPKYDREQPLDYKMEIASLFSPSNVLYISSLYQDDLDSDYERVLYQHVREQNLQDLGKRREIAETFVNNFMPRVHFFFTAPKRPEQLVGFIHFLLQVLNSESHHIRYWGRGSGILTRIQSWSDGYLREKLKFILFVLGDFPFRFTDIDQVKNILIEIEIVASEAGNFVYSYFFRTSRVNAAQFVEDILVLLQKFDMLKVKIEEHCMEFSKLPLPICARPTTISAVDSLFIVESLLGDILSFFTNPRFRQGTLTAEAMKHHITTLQMELVFAQSFLKDKNVPEEIEFQELKIHIRDVAYEAEYLLNSYVVGDLPDSYFSLRLPVIIKKFELIRKEFTETKTISKVKVLKVENHLSVETPQKMVLNPGAVDDDGGVGFQYEMVEILDDLTGGSEDLKFICIYGMPGLGKTTLARRLYNHSLVASRFDKCAWCVVSQTYQKRKVLVEILQSLRSMLGKDKISEMGDESLISHMYKTLIGKRYLVIIDDVWDSSMWNDLGRYFPNDRNGSRLLFTTRIRDSAPINSSPYTPRVLSNDESWKLLKKKVFLDEPCPPQLQGSGKRIAEKCKGLPLAVVVIAGTLVNMPKEIRAWEKVEKSLETFTSDCREILELSYKHLPNHLKLCFLYLGVFPEDTQIQVKKLIRLWSVEGFVEKVEGKCQEHVAEEYLMELINRSLVQVAKPRSTCGVKTCSVHDLLREMCLEISEEENFLNLVENDKSSTSEKYQRLCVLPTAQVHLRPFSLHCRSLSGNLSDLSSCLPQMKRLKVLELTLRRGTSRNNLFLGINLLWLRYLVIDQIPPENILDNFVNLEVLCVDNYHERTSVVDVSPIILKLKKLRHLHIYRSQFLTYCYSSKPIHLQSLSDIKISSAKDYDNLRSLPHLQKFTYNYQNQPLGLDFQFLTELKSLTIRFNGSRRSIPKYKETINYPLSIKKLSLSGTQMPWKMMSDVGRLPELQSLKLFKDAFTGRIWKTDENEFQNLRFLKLFALNIEQWIAPSEHFPRLCHLVLYDCSKLLNLPTELGDIPTLQTIEVHDCSYGASISAVQVEQEQRDNGNGDLQVIITNHRWSKEQLLFKYKELEEQFSTETRRTNSSGVDTERGLPVHAYATCDYCQMFPIIGDRYKCKNCVDKWGYDLCGNCYSPNRSNRLDRYNKKHTSEHEFEIVISNERLYLAGRKWNRGSSP